MDYALAQVNIGRLLAPLDSPQLADFAAALDPVNSVADAAPGFVWRLQSEEGNATSLRAFEDDAAGTDGDPGSTSPLQRPEDWACPV